MSVLLERLDAGVLTLTLNRPRAYNALTRELALALQAQLARATSDDAVRAVVVTGAGKAFGAGQDLQELVADDAPPVETILTEGLNPIISALRACPKPVIAAVNGVAAGAAVSLAAACDIVVAAASARFVLAFTHVGLAPDGGASWTLPRVLGHHRAAALMLTGEPLGAAEAHRVGLVWKVIADADFAAEVDALARRLAAAPTLALGLTKRALDASAMHTLDQQLAYENELQQSAAASADHAEGVAAFLAKRTPSFTGR